MTHFGGKVKLMLKTRYIRVFITRFWPFEAWIGRKDGRGEKKSVPRGTLRQFRGCVLRDGLRNRVSVPRGTFDYLRGFHLLGSLALSGVPLKETILHLMFQVEHVLICRLFGLCGELRPSKLQ